MGWKGEGGGGGRKSPMCCCILGPHLPAQQLCQCHAALIAVPQPGHIPGRGGQNNMGAQRWGGHKACGERGHTRGGAAPQ